VRRRRHTPEQIVRKLREAERMVAEGKTTAEAAKARWGSPEQKLDEDAVVHSRSREARRRRVPGRRGTASVPARTASGFSSWRARRLARGPLRSESRYIL